MLLQALHDIQQRFGFLPPRALKELAVAHQTPLYRVQELIGFYPHFTTNDNPPRLELHVCRDMACHMNGACDLRVPLEKTFNTDPPGPVAVKGVSCLGRCDRAPAALLYRRDANAETALQVELYMNITRDNMTALLRGERLLSAPKGDRDEGVKRFMEFPWLIDVYKGKARDYQAVQLYRQWKEPQQVFDRLRNANLLGMGGAGGRAFKKWEEVLAARQNALTRSGDGTAYVVCNADESEPGTFKDRDLLVHFPHLVVEGVILGGLVVGARQGYIYVRHEYHEQIHRLREAIRDAEHQGVCGPATHGTEFHFDLEVFVSPGGYICGEQSALIQAIQDQRAEPRNRPPELQTNGLWDRPTLLSNVETFAWTPAIMLRDEGRWYAQQGKAESKGRRLFSISGVVKYPGVYEVPIGITLRELLETYANRARDEDPFKAFAASGPSGGFLPRRIPLAALRRPSERESANTARFRRERLSGVDHLDLLDLELDLTLWRDLGLMLGAGLIVYGKKRDLAQEALNCLEFYRNESCGQCTPCRIGSEKLVQIGKNLIERRYDAAKWGEQRQLIEKELAPTMRLTSICGLGTVAFAPITSLLKYFPDEWKRYL